MVTITLYTTEHCTLCDTAFDWLQQCTALRGATVQTIDVADNDTLLEQFGPRVPVLAAGARTIDWPFTESKVQALIAATRAP